MAERALGILATLLLAAGCAGTPANAPMAQPSAEAGREAGSGTEHSTAVPIGREQLAGLGLQEWPAMSDEDVLEGGTGHRGEVFYSGDELVVEVWEADASKLDLGVFPYDEFVLVLSGKLVLTDGRGTATEYVAGDSFVVPKGFQGTWQMFGNYRELVVIEKEAYVRVEGEE
jgi:uncharacterized cupin superfamily protein